ncbi:MAG: phosphoribosylanthranilate isomerase [Acidobacteriaceae bacterium]
MWVKVCANTSLEDARMAAEAGANAVGFVFAESVRRVTVAQVRAITPHLPENIEKIGIFVDASLNDLIAAIRDCGLTGVQFHSGCESDVAARLRERFPPQRLRILNVIHFQRGVAMEMRVAQADQAVDAVVVDSRTAKLVGGTGIRFDWQAARGSFAGSPLRLVVAGGLNPENVGEAIAALRPWGVDVASGVEAAPGKKDAARVRAFVENARIAAHKLGPAAVEA